MRFLLAVSVLSCTFSAQGARIMRKQKRATESGQKFIEGVPVHNYELTKSYQMRTFGVAQVATQSVATQSEDDVEEDWIIDFKNGVSDSALESLCAGKQCGIKCHPSEGGVPVISFHGSQKGIAKLIHGHTEEVEIVEPDLPVYAIPEIHEDPGSLIQARAHANFSMMPWGLQKIGASTRSSEGKGVHVYVLDTGVRTTHNDFGGRAIPTLEFTSDSPRECRGSTSCARDVHGHGTHCAGSAAGTNYGVAPKATIHGVKVLSDEGSGSLSWIVGALDWVITKAEHPAVVSMSLGGPGQSRAYQIAIDKAVEAAVTVVVASGNENSDACGYSPAFVSSAITVGSTSNADRRSSFSNFGRCVQIYAPGSDILSAGHQYDSDSATMSGTSMACPHVSGAAALLLESNPRWSVAQVKDALTRNAKANTISGLTSACPNLLLHVGDGTSNPVPTPSPTPAPSPNNCQYDEATCSQYCYYSFCSGCASCMHTPAPTPAPVGECRYSESVCSYNCNHPWCSGCTICRRAPTPAPVGECRYAESFCAGYCSQSWCSGCNVCRR